MMTTDDVMKIRLSLVAMDKPATATGKQETEPVWASNTSAVKRTHDNPTP